MREDGWRTARDGVVLCCPVAPMIIDRGFLMAGDDDIKYMKRALALAARARGRTRPNPMVGAIVVRGGRVVGEGYHHAAGQPHAEVMALRQAGDKAHGATIYVTLEPCCHTGRTGPCTEEIRQAGIARVVYAVNDPDPRVNCRGGQCLTDAAIEVESGVLEEEARCLNEAYFGYHANRRPWVVLKMAQTLDGRIATSTGDSQWISGEASLRLAHRLRTEADAVVIGMGTVRKDNPSLTVRHVRGSNPYRIVLTSSVRFPRKCKLLHDNSDYKTIVAATRDAADQLARSKQGRNIIIWKLKTNRQGSVDTKDLLRQADQFGIRSLLLEGGSALATTFLKRRLVDKVVLVTAPMILGHGTDSVGDLRIRKLAKSISFRNYSFGRCNGDSVFTGYPVWSE